MTNTISKFGTIRDVARGRALRAGSGGAWRLDETMCGRRGIYHYGTLMIAFTVVNEDGLVEWDGDPGNVYLSTGNGSVSDQGGMNEIFKTLGMPFYFSRKGGATIHELANV